MEISYRQDINHNYMIIRKERQGELSFPEKMLLHNRIPGLLKMTIQHLNGETFYCYDIRSMQAITNFYEGRLMKFEEIRSLLAGFEECAAGMGSYLLSASALLMKPECVFRDLESNNPVFCCCPENTGETGEYFLEFARFLIDHTDPEDENAVRLSYDYYQQASDGIFSPGNLLKRQGELSTPEEKSPNLTPSENQPLPVESLWKDEENKDYYYGMPELKTEEKTPAPKKTKTPAIVLSAAVILLSACIFALLVFFPASFDFTGLSRDNYLMLGGGAALLFTAALGFLLHTVLGRRDRKNKDAAAPEIPEISSDPVFRFHSDTLEEEERKSEEERRSLKAYSGQTVLLTEYSGKTEPEISAGTPMLIRDPEGKRELIEIEKTPFMIGKLAGHADLVIADQRISRLHACIRKEGSRFFLSDLNSTNGTFLNGRRLEQNEAAALEDGDLIRLAGINMKFKL
ncbi:MAG: FHA domain-containing protein [Lachnospiraceae bacterium]|nr:FHA domain-containing protein [Lachnospiraceae bacterium]